LRCSVTQSLLIRHRRFAFLRRELDAVRLINGVLTIETERIVGTPNFLTCNWPVFRGESSAAPITAGVFPGRAKTTGKSGDRGRKLKSEGRVQKVGDVDRAEGSFEF